MKRKLIGLAIRLLVTLAVIRVFVSIAPGPAHTAGLLFTQSGVAMALLFYSALSLRDWALVQWAIRIKLHGVGGKSSAQALARNQ